MFSGQKSASATTSFSSLSPSLGHSRVHHSLFGKYLRDLLRVHGTCKEQSAPGPPSREPEAPWPQLCRLPPTRTPGRHRCHPHLVVVEAGLGGTAAAPQFEPSLTPRLRDASASPPRRRKLPRLPRLLPLSPPPLSPGPSFFWLILTG